MDNCHICERELMVWESTVEHPYHYMESGLSHVFLAGVTVYSCPNCETASADIPNMDGLHHLIAKDLILRPVTMTGEELRFLRKEARRTPKAFAELIEVDPKTVSNWESSAKISKQIDVALRFILSGELFHGDELNEVLHGLSELAEYSWEGEPQENLDDEVRRLTAFNTSHSIDAPIWETA